MEKIITKLARVDGAEIVWDAERNRAIWLDRDGRDQILDLPYTTKDVDQAYQDICAMFNHSAFQFEDLYA